GGVELGGGANSSSTSNRHHVRSGVGREDDLRARESEMGRGGTPPRGGGGCRPRAIRDRTSDNGRPGRAAAPREADGRMGRDRGLLRRGYLPPGRVPLSGGGYSSIGRARPGAGGPGHRGGHHRVGRG